MTDLSPQRSHYWERRTGGDGRWRPSEEAPPGAELAALRRGVGREAGSVPSMWPFYSTLNESGHATKALLAEHVALTLFAVHQQSRPLPMHRKGIGLGSAVLALRRSGAFSAEAVDRRFAATATATSLAELSVHLRGLVTQLRGEGQALDYTSLFRNLLDWQHADRAPSVRRKWGSQYFAPSATVSPTPPNPDVNHSPISKELT